MRKNRWMLGMILLLIFSLTACTGTTGKEANTSAYIDAAQLLTEVKTAQFFTEEKVPEEDVEKFYRQKSMLQAL